MDDNLSYNTSTVNLTDSLYYLSEAYSEIINTFNTPKLKQFADTYQQISEQFKINNIKAYLYMLIEPQTVCPEQQL